MTEDEADARARELNRELGRQRVKGTFFVSVELEPGVWDVDQRVDAEDTDGEPRTLLGKLVDGVLRYMP